MPTHDTGVWLTDDGEVVYEQPKGGSTVLIAKGGEVSAADKQRLAAYGLEDVNLPAEDDADEAPAEEPAEDEPETVKSEDVKPAKKPAKRARKSST